MSDQITTARAVGFGKSVFHLAQQKGSKLREFCMVKPVNGVKREYFDRLGSTTASIKSARHQATPLTDSQHSRRAVDLTDYHWADLVDHEDNIRMLWDPKGPYQQAAMWALGRAYDDEIIDALGGTALTGEDGSGSATLASYESGAHVIANGGTGLTVAKLRQAYRLFETADVDTREGLVAVISPIAQDQLMQDVQVTSRDFTMNQVLADGTIDGKTFMGMRFVVSTRLDVASDIRTCFVFAPKLAVAVAEAQAPQSFIDRRPDVSQAWQVYVRMSMGGVRLQEQAVVSVDIDETA